MRIPNVVVNGCSVLILSLQNNLKVAEKVELFKSLSNQYLILAHSIEALEPEAITREIINNFTESMILYNHNVYLMIYRISIRFR